MRSKYIKSPSLIITSPRFQDLFVTSPHTIPSLNQINQDQVYNETLNIILTEESLAWKTGIILLFASLICWIVALQIVNVIMKHTDYDHPLFAAYLNGSFFIIYGFKQLINEAEKFLKSNKTMERTPLVDDIVDKLHIPTIRLSHSQILKTGILSSLFYFANCYLGSAALKYTSASNQTILATTSSIWSLLIGVLLKIESFTLGKTISVICSILGISLITFTDTINILTLSTEQFGNIIATIGAFSYSCFLVVLRLKLGEQTDSTNDALLYGYIGLSTLILGTPILVIYNLFNWEHLALPQSNTILLMLIVSSILSATSDYLASRASVITSPLTVSLSLAAAIPVNMCVDAFINGGLNISMSYLLGISLIFASFMFVNLSSESEIIQLAITDAIDEAIDYDQHLISLLSPSHQSTDLLDNVPHLELPNQCVQRVVITGGENHKYFLREVDDE